MNNHPLFSMSMSIRGHPYSRTEKRSAFFCLNCVALSFSVFVQAMKLGSVGSLMFNMFVVSPVMLIINYQMYILLACPCTMSLRAAGGCRSACAACLNALGWVILLPTIGGCIVFLLMASLFNDGGLDRAGIHIASFAYSVHLLSSVQEFVWAFRLFMTGRYCISVSLLNCFPLVTFGDYFRQKIKYAGLVEGIDFEVVPKRRLLCGLICYDGVRSIQQRVAPVGLT
jgi:hypothetical protein